MNLFPENYEDEIVDFTEIEESGPIGYRNGVAFDDEFGEFLRDGKNKLIDSTGIESWKSWCSNCLQTERYKYLAYDTDFGIELDPVFSASSPDEAEALLTRQITEAILADPYERASYIENIEYEWTAPDVVYAHVTIRGIDDVSIDVEAYLTKGEV